LLNKRKIVVIPFSDDAALAKMLFDLEYLDW